MTSRRPRLSDRLAPRRHFLEGSSSTERVVLHRMGEAAGRTMMVGSREWTLLALMDGSRDAAGLAFAARERGKKITPEEAEAFIEECVRADLVEAEAAIEPASGVPLVEASEASEDRLIEQLPGFRLHCDGRGSCCRFYPTITFSPLEAARARSALPRVRDGGEDEERVFTPEQGASRRSLAVALVEGRCAYLEKDGGCGVHRVSGAASKPLGCNLFPAAFVDDGRAIRVSPAVECACILRSALPGKAVSSEPVSSELGAPLLDPSTTRRSQLDPRAHVQTLPARIERGRGLVWERAEYVDFFRAIEGESPGDAVAALVALATVVSSDAPTIEAAKVALRNPPPPSPTPIARRIEALGKRIGQRASDTWRAPSDLTHQTFVALDAAVALAGSELPLLLSPSPRTAEAEAFYLRAAFFGHHLITRSCHVPLAESLLDRAARLVLARALLVVAELGELADPAFEMPLALVEATLRSYGLATYVLDDLG